MAQSVKTDFNIWSQFDPHAYDIITEDFVHDSLFKVNINILTNKGKVRLLETIAKKDSAISTRGQANFWFPVIGNKSLYIQNKRTGFRLHFDNGLFTMNRFNHNLYASLQSSKNLESFLIKVGCETIAQKWRYNLRYRYSTEEEEHTIYSRWRYDYENWTFQGIKALRLNDFLLLKNNFLIGYYANNKTFHFRLENQDWRSDHINFSKVTFQDIFDHAIFNFTKTLNGNSRFGLQALIKTSGEFKPFSFVWETYDPIYQINLKLKANTDMSAAISIGNKMGSYGNYVLGVGIQDVGNKNKLSFGVKIDLNL